MREPLDLYLTIESSLHFKLVCIALAVLHCLLTLPDKYEVGIYMYVEGSNEKLGQSFARPTQLCRSVSWFISMRHRRSDDT